MQLDILISFPVAMLVQALDVSSWEHRIEASSGVANTHILLSGFCAGAFLDTWLACNLGNLGEP